MHLHSSDIAKNEVDSNNIKFVQNIRKMDRFHFPTFILVYQKPICSIGFKSICTLTAVILTLLGMPSHLSPRVHSSSINICWYLQLKLLEVGTHCKQNPDEIQ